MAKRLIDAKAFDLRLSQKKITEVFPNWKKLPQKIREAVGEYAQYFHMLLETQPTVDAVEVVRCRECKYYRCKDSKVYRWVPDTCAEGVRHYCIHPKGMSVVGKDTFCSCGERSTDE